MTLLAHDDPEAIRAVTEALDAGELAVLPTDTLYALACDALVEEAAYRVFDVKRRPADSALPVCVSGIEDVHHVAVVTPLARDLASRFWPGALTLVLKAKAWVPDVVTAGQGTVAVRVPANAFARDLARHFGPFTVSSANRHGEPPAARVQDAVAALGSDVRVYVDGGALPGTPSTMVDATGDVAKVLREGAVRAAEITSHAARGR